MLFLVNFIMNGFVLWLVGKIARKKHPWRVVLAAGVMAAMYTLLIAVEALRFTNVPLASVVILGVGLVVAFPFKRLGEFFKLGVVAYVISFTVGGLGMSLFFLTDVPYALYFITSDPGAFMREVSWQLALTGAVVSYVLLKVAIKIYQRHSLKRQMFCRVQIFMGEALANVHALVDTGHSLKEPLSKAPVIIAEFEQVKNCLPPELKVLFYEKQEYNLGANLESDFCTRIRMIPFSSLGKKGGLLIGFKPDRIALEGHEGAPQDVIIGIYNDKLCMNGRYQGLLSPELIA